MDLPLGKSLLVAGVSMARSMPWDLLPSETENGVVWIAVCHVPLLVVLIVMAVVCFGICKSHWQRVAAVTAFLVGFAVARLLMQRREQVAWAQLIANIPVDMLQSFVRHTFLVARLLLIQRQRELYVATKVLLTPTHALR